MMSALLAGCQNGGAFDPITFKPQDLAGSGTGSADLAVPDLLPAQLPDCKAAQSAARCRVTDFNFTLGSCNTMAKWMTPGGNAAQIQIGANNNSTESISCGGGNDSRTCEATVTAPLALGTARAVRLKFDQEHYLNAQGFTAGSFGITRGALLVNGTPVFGTGSNQPGSPYSVTLPLDSNIVNAAGGSYTLKLQVEVKCINYSSPPLGMYWHIENMTAEIDR